MFRFVHQLGDPSKNRQKRVGVRIGLRSMIRFEHQLGDPLEKFIKNGPVCGMGLDTCSVLSTSSATPSKNSSKMGRCAHWAAIHAPFHPLDWQPLV